MTPGSWLAARHQRVFRTRSRYSELELTPAGEGPAQCYLVCVLEVSPTGRPEASAVTRTGRSFTSWAMNIAVASPVVFGLVAMTSSLVPSFSMRVRSSAMRRSSGSTPSSGEREPGHGRGPCTR